MRFLLILFFLICLVPNVNATDYNFYRCSDGLGFGTEYNITFTVGGSNSSVCINTTDTQSTNFAVEVSGYYPEIEVPNETTSTIINAGNLDNPLFGFDEDFDTYTTINTVPVTNASIYLNFSNSSTIIQAKIEHRLEMGSTTFADNIIYCYNSSNQWQQIYSAPDEKPDNTINTTIPSSCLETSTLQIWHFLKGNGGVSFAILYESSIWYTGPAYPTNVTLDINNDTTNEWSMTGELNSTNSPQWTSDVPVNTITVGGLKVLNFTSDTAGTLELSGINYGPVCPSINLPSVTTNTSITLNSTCTDPDDDLMLITWYNNSAFLVSGETPLNNTQLMGAWHMNDNNNLTNTTDYSGNGNHGAIFGATYTTGRFESGLEFDGNDARINIDSLVDDVSDNTIGTISAWIKLNDATPSDFNAVFSISDTNVNEGFVIRMNTDGTLNTRVIDAGTEQWQLSTTAAIATDDVWVHITLLQDGVEPVICIDGDCNIGQSFSVTTDKTAWLANLSGLDNARIGTQDINSFTNLFDFVGTIDEVRIYNRTLSATEILDEYNLAFGYYNWTHADVESTYTMTVNVSDSYSNATASENVTIDYTDVFLYDEPAGTIFDNESNALLISFQNGTGFQTIQSVEDINTTFKNIDTFIGQPIRIDVRNTSHPTYPHPRSVAEATYAAGEDFNIYLPSVAQSVVAPSFILTDITGDFDPQTTVLRILRFIGVVQVTVFEDFFDVENDASAFLITDTHYTVEVQSSGGEVRDLGAYVPESAEDVSLFIGPVQYAPGDNINDLIIWNVTEGSIDVNYHDATGNTTTLSIIIYNASNTSQILANCTDLDVSSRTCTWNALVNESVFVQINATTGFGWISLSKYFRYYSGQLRKIDVGLLEDWHYELLSLIIIMIVFMSFNEINSGVGAVTAVGTLGLLTFMGWATVASNVMGLLTILALMAFLRGDSKR